MYVEKSFHKKIDKGTFGNSRAAVVLVEILNETENNIRLIRDVGNILHTFNNHLIAINNIDTKQTFSISRLIYNYAISRTETLPANVKTFTINLIKTKMRIFLKEHKLIKNDITEETV